jgi:hypothetical protein
MAANEKNFKIFDYLDDSGNHWNVRGEAGGSGSAIDGHAALDAANPLFGTQTRRRHTRHVVAQNATNFRTIKFIVYTPTAYAAIAIGDTIAVQVPGSATTVDYLVSDKLAERIPGAKASRNLAD